MSRDPRIDPRPGDVVRRLGIVTRYVTAASENCVWYQLSNDATLGCLLQEWRLEMKNSEVINVAE